MTLPPTRPVSPLPNGSVWLSPSAAGVVELPEPGPPAEETSRPPLPADCRAFLDKVLELQLVTAADLEQFLQERSARLGADDNPQELGAGLVEARLLTAHQADRVLAGRTHGLVLGNYRVLDRLGAGGMGVVFLAEHALLKRQVAIKVLPLDEDCPRSLRQRFYAEMRVQADLHHPHVALAYDAGEVPPPGPNMPHLMYLVMELVTGGDLEEYILDHGPVPVAQACDWIRQAASGLQAAHDRHLIHRDIKPSNLLLTSNGEVKLVDFGLVRQFCSSLTPPRALMGSLEFMAPEQSHDSTAVGGAVDIYGLGATLFWLLTGEPPYPITRVISKALRALQSEPPRRVRSLRPEVPPELDELIARLLDRDPARRPATPLNVVNALTPFIVGSSRIPSPEAASGNLRQPTSAALNRSHRVLIVEDNDGMRRLIRATLEKSGCHCTEAGDGETGLDLSRQESFDVILLDLNLPGMNGYEVCRQLRQHPPRTHLKIIIISGAGNTDQLVEALPRGADDYIAKPFAPRQLEAKVRHALDMQAAEDQIDQLLAQVLVTNRQLEQSLQARADDVRQAQDALLFAMAKMAELRDGETPGHLRRLQRYTRCLAERVAQYPSWQGLVDSRFLENLERCVPLHDIGKIGLPDEVLLKPGKLNDHERALVETHTVVGDRLLELLGEQHGASLEFLRMARSIVRHHHERYDGRGYPDRLRGDEIPGAARLVAIADVYDTLRRQRLYKPAWPHEQAVRCLLDESGGQFDPMLLQAFAACQHEFERIYREVGE